MSSQRPSPSTRQPNGSSGEAKPQEDNPKAYRIRDQDKYGSCQIHHAPVPFPQCLAILFTADSAASEPYGRAPDQDMENYPEQCNKAEFLRVQSESIQYSGVQIMTYPMPARKVRGTMVILVVKHE